MYKKLHSVQSKSLSIEIDGETIQAEPGETVAAVLLRQKEPWSRLTSISEDKRAPFCMMGVCFECLVEVDGVPSVQSCLIPVADGMIITRQRGKRKVTS